MSNAERTRRWRAKHPLWKTWTCLMQRCGIHKGASEYTLAQYAGRGITVCDEWKKFKSFEGWALANGWKLGLQLDRIDNNGNYCPENCRFVTRRENNLNKRNTVMFGDKPVAHWYDFGHVDGLSYKTFLQRFVGLNWPICRALFESVSHK